MLTLVSVGLAAIALLLLTAAGPAYQLGALTLPTAFLALRCAAYAGVLGAALNLLAWVSSLKQRRWVRSVVTLVAFVVSLACLTIPLRWQLAARRLPPIHDISTDIDKPPTFTAIVPLREPTDNSLERTTAVDEAQRRGYPDIQPITVPVPVAEAFEEAIELIQEHEWQIVNADKEHAVLEAIATTPWFGFKDDVVVRLTAAATGTRIDMRSVSRIGLSDVGTNARRIREFLNELQRGQ
jgi:uncharacterized protein (DUF1499 family)